MTILGVDPGTTESGFSLVGEVYLKGDIND